MTFQTSDFAKLALFMYLSRQLSRKQEVIKDFKKGFVPLIVPVLITCVLIMPANLSNALLTAATALLLLFIGRVSVKHILLVIALALIPILIIVSVAVSTYHPNTDATVTQTKAPAALRSFGRFNTWVSRVQDFIYAKDNEAPYQVQQAKIAIANGGILFGRGPGNSLQRNYLPQAYNDFQKMPLCFRGFPSAGIEFHSCDTGHCQHGGECEYCSRNRRYVAADKYGWQFIFIYLCGHWYL